MARTRLFGDRIDADVESVAPTRDERRLLAVRDKIEAIHLVSTDNFNLPARYRALVKLESILHERVGASLLADQSR